MTVFVFKLGVEIYYSAEKTFQNAKKKAFSIKEIQKSGNSSLSRAQ